MITSAVPASATGGLWCRSDDANLTFTAQAGVGAGIDEGFLNFAADLALKLQGVPTDLRRLHFDESAIGQRWLDTKEFKLRLYRQRNAGPPGEVVLVVQTTAVGEGDYRGRYALRVFAMRSAADVQGESFEKTGAVVCGAE